MDETWKDVPGFENYYQVSNLGRVKSYDRTVIESSGITRKHYGKIIHNGLAGCGYAQVHLYVNGVQTVTYAHRLVAAAFIGPCPEDMQVNHKNGNKLDNRLENLEYVTPSENNRHAFRVLGRKSKHPCQRGERNSQSKLKSDDVLRIRALYAKGDISQDRLASMFMVAQATISLIIAKRTWMHV